MFLIKLPNTTIAPPHRIPATFPYSIEKLSPRLSSETTPPYWGSVIAVPIHAASAMNSPPIAPATAAFLSVFFHIMVKAIGITAEPMRTPMAR